LSLFLCMVWENAFTLFHVAVRFSQPQLLKRRVYIYFSSIYSCFLHCRLSGHKCVGCFWAFSPVLLIYASVFVPVPSCFDDYNFEVQSEIRDYDSSTSVLLSQDCLVVWIFCVSIQILKLFYTCQTLCGNHVCVNSLTSPTIPATRTSRLQREAEKS